MEENGKSQLETGASQSQVKAPEYEIDKFALESKLENLRLDQNLAMGLIGGSIGGGVGAAIWTLITYFTEYQIGWMSIGVAFLVGFGVSRLGKGLDRIYGMMGAIISLVSVVLGNFLTALAFLAKHFGATIWEVLLGFDYSLTLDLMVETFNLMDLLFYAFAVYFGYKYSFRKISQEELLDGVMVKTDRPDLR